MYQLEGYRSGTVPTLHNNPTHVMHSGRSLACIGSEIRRSESPERPDYLLFRTAALARGAVVAIGVIRENLSVPGSDTSCASAVRCFSDNSEH